MISTMLREDYVSQLSSNTVESRYVPLYKFRVTSKCDRFCLFCDRLYGRSAVQASLFYLPKFLSSLPDSVFDLSIFGGEGSYAFSQHKHSSMIRGLSKLGSRLRNVTISSNLLTTKSLHHVALYFDSFGERLTVNTGWDAYGRFSDLRSEQSFMRNLSIAEDLFCESSFVVNTFLTVPFFERLNDVPLFQNYRYLPIPGSVHRSSRFTPSFPVLVEGLEKLSLSRKRYPGYELEKLFEEISNPQPTYFCESSNSSSSAGSYRVTSSLCLAPCGHETRFFSTPYFDRPTCFACALKEALGRYRD